MDVLRTWTRLEPRRTTRMEIVSGATGHESDRPALSRHPVARCPRDRTTSSRHGAQVTLTAFVRLNVLTVQNAAALRYQTW
jgi:hypothetical protein